MKIQLKRSNAIQDSKAKPPAESNMDTGELAINYSSLDPAFFIKDDDGHLVKMPIGDNTNVQSDWAENNTGSPAYIKNRELVDAQFNSVNADLSKKLESAPLDGKQYGHQSGGWTEVKVQEAPSVTDDVQYVRKNGQWVPLFVDDVNFDGYATEDWVKEYVEAENLTQSADLLVAAGNIASALDDDQTTAIFSTIASQNYVSDAAEDGNFYCRSNGAWIAFNPSSGGGGGGGDGTVDLSNYVTLNSNQSISGSKTFTGGILNTGLFAFPNSVNHTPYLATDGNGNPVYGYEITWSNYTGGSQRGGMVVSFQQKRQDGEIAGNVKIGLRTAYPDTALDVDSSMKARQYQNYTRGAFNGHIFSSPDGFEFLDHAYFFQDVVQSGGTYHRIDNTPASYGNYSLEVSGAEKAVAAVLRQQLRGFVYGSKRKFCIDKNTIVNAFRGQGLDVDNYELLKEITLPATEGLKDEDTNLDVGSRNEMTYTAVDYQALFAFCLAASPDVFELEARLTALENA